MLHDTTKQSLKKCDFNAWFDVNNKEHMRAYAELLSEGRWPPHFIPADVTFDNTSALKGDWQQMLNHRIVEAYVKLMTAGPVYRKQESRTRPEFS